MNTVDIKDKSSNYIKYNSSIGSRNLLVFEGCTSWFTQGELSFIQYIWY